MGGGLEEADILASSNHPNARNWGRFDSSALHIRHALNATEVQKKYSRPKDRPIETFLVSIAIERARCVGL